MPEQEEAAAPAKDNGLLSGVKGWIIVGGVVLLNWVFFFLYIHFGRAPVNDEQKTDGPAAEQLVDPPENVLTVGPLVYTTETGAPAMSISMKITLVFGYTDEEKRNPKSENKPGEEVLVAYKDYALASMDYLKDHLVSYMGAIEPSALRSSTGKQRIRDEVRTYMNQHLQSYLPKGAPPGVDRRRVTQVLLPEWAAAPLD